MPPKKTINHLELLFCVGLALLMAHELDAMFRHEWRILPGLRLLSDDTGRTVFVLGHIPLLAAIFCLVGHRTDAIRLRTQIILDVFMIAHAIAHYLMRNHPLYEFEPPIETITVYGAGLVGLVHATTVHLSRSRMATKSK